MSEGSIAGCPFCGPGAAETASMDLAFARHDAFPVGPGHTLIVPRRHVASWFDATPDERSAMLRLLNEVKAALDRELHPAGYNVGFNVGEAGGQTVMHLHLHVIPRFHGDVDDPRGGVRLAIPERGNYRRPGHIPRAMGARSAGE